MPYTDDRPVEQAVEQELDADIERSIEALVKELIEKHPEAQRGDLDIISRIYKKAGAMYSKWL